MGTDQDQAGPAAPARVIRWAERARSSPYFPALSHPVFRNVLPGAAASALGDGMRAVAIGCLALGGLLDLPAYVALLGASLLSAWVWPASTR